MQRPVRLAPLAPRRHHHRGTSDRTRVDRFLLQRERERGGRACAAREAHAPPAAPELAREWQAGMDLVGLVKSVVPFMPLAQVRAAGPGGAVSAVSGQAAGCALALWELPAGWGGSLALALCSPASTEPALRTSRPTYLRTWLRVGARSTSSQDLPCRLLSHLSCGDLSLGYSVPTMEEEGDPPSSSGGGGGG